MGTIRVVLADDHALLRAGIRAILQNMEGIEVVAEATDGIQALALVREHKPDLLVTDIAMPGRNGLEVTAEVCAEHSEIRVLILSMHASEEYVSKALAAGAGGYILKDADPTELESAVRAVARGESYLTQAVSRHLIADYKRRLRGEGEGGTALTPRQKEILQLVAEGKTTKEIARALHISVKTVETHRGQLMDRLEIHDIAGLVRYAIRIGLIRPEP